MNFISNGLKVYNLSNMKKFPDWINKSRRLKRSDDYQKRVELIQEFEFPISTTCLQETPDSQYVVGTGVYPPQIRIFDLHEFSLHHERHITTDAIQMSILSRDYSQMAFLRGNRYLEFHQKGGGYFSMRIPKSGRDMVYDAESCELVVCCSGSSVYRLNVNLGQWMSPWKTNLDTLTVCAINPVHGLLGFGDESGKLQFFDPRSRHSLALIDLVDVLKPTLSSPFEISSLAYAEDGLTLGIGTTHGHVPIYDLRTSTPSIVKLHQNQLPIKNVRFHTANNITRVFSTDAKVLKIWDHKESSGRVFCSLESQPNQDISAVCPIKGSGIIFMGGTQPEISAYYVPDLGPVPKWGSFIENITEELATENSSSIYEDYKFVTRDELAKLGMTKLLGTDYLKAYMHGYFVNTNLYLKMRTIAQPYSRKDHLQQKAREIIEKDTRISVKRELKVKGKPVSKILGETENVQEGEEGKQPVLIDERFSALTTNPDFDIPRNKKNYQVNNSNTNNNNNTNTLNNIKQRNVSAHFEKIDGENESEGDEEDDDENERDNENETRKRKLDFYEIKTGHNAAVALRDQLSNTLRDESRVPLSKRATKYTAESDEMKFSQLSEPTNLEITYEPKKKKKNPKPKVATRTPQRAIVPRDGSESGDRRQLFANDVKTEQWRKSREFRVSGLKKSQR